MKETIPPKTGFALEVSRGELIKISCPDAAQVSDLVAFNRHDLTEALNNGKTFDYEETLRLTSGNRLYSNLSNVMLEIIADSCGVHDFLLAPCCPETLRHFYGIEEERPTCRDNLYAALKGYGLERWQIPTAFNIFMNVEIDKKLGLKVQPPKAKAGDYITFRAEMDLLLGITACAAGATNNYAYAPIEIMVMDTTES